MIYFLLTSIISAGWDCSTVLPLSNGATVTFDLSRFQKAETFRHIRKSSTTNDLGEWDWYFEVCGDTNEIPHPECCDQTWVQNQSPRPEFMEDQQTGFLDEKFPDSPIFMTGPGPAWQVEYNETSNTCSRCYRLGRSYTETNGVTNPRGVMSWGLKSDINPSEGVYIEYQEGDTQIPGCQGRNRMLRLEFECAPSAASSQSAVLDLENAYVTEEPRCTYTIKFRSTAGCPAECPHRIRNGLEQICDGHGHCDIDVGLKKPRCFCDIGWSGIDCGTPTSDEVAMSTERCYPVDGGYVKGQCSADMSTYAAQKYSDASCTQSRGSQEMFVTRKCVNIFGLETGIECLVDNGPAIFRASYCEVMESDSNNGSSKSNTTWLVLLILLVTVLLVAVGYLVYRQMQQPDLKNFLVLNDDNTTQL